MIIIFWCIRLIDYNRALFATISMNSSNLRDKISPRFGALIFRWGASERGSRRNRWVHLLILKYFWWPCYSWYTAAHNSDWKDSTSWNHTHSRNTSLGTFPNSCSCELVFPTDILFYLQCQFPLWLDDRRINSSA